MDSTRPPRVPEGDEAYRFVWEALAPETATSAADPVIRAVMIASVDGTISVAGRSAPLGTPTDQLVYQGMRARSDLIVAGARTALLEDYGPAHLSEQWRRLRGDRPTPTVLLVANTLTDMLVDHCVRRSVDAMAVAVQPSDRDVDARERAAELGLTVHELEGGRLGDSLRALAARLGAGEVAFEGGPRLLGVLVAHDAIDELVLSTSPKLFVGSNPTGVVSGDAGTHTPMRVVSTFTCAEGGLYSRWARAGGAT